MNPPGDDVCRGWLPTPGTSGLGGGGNGKRRAMTTTSEIFVETTGPDPAEPARAAIRQVRRPPQVRIGQEAGHAA